MEIGAFAIKAIRLEREGDTVRVSDFAVIPHKKVLTTPDLDQDEMVRLSLGQFISQKVLEGEHLVMSVPGHAAFARFAKLPPVEPKKVPDIVRFEAVQQIPFPIDEVEWDYQTFAAPDTPEIEVGIFAITRERVQQRLGLYAELGITPESLTLSPLAVFNAMMYDLGLGNDLGGRAKALMLLDIGTSATDLIVAEAGRCWIRTFPLGGTHFTEAIAAAFKLSYSKAEKLKEEAATSKYAKQIMQAMRPVFSDLLQDVQRSMGYYQSLHRDTVLDTMYGVGSTFKIPGLRKFLGQQLQMTVNRLDEYKKIQVTGREAASFAENAVNMGTAYGLALQGVGLAPIDANLVPVKALRDQVWQNKTKWFAAAAAIIIVGAAMTLYRPLVDRSALNPGGVFQEVDNAISTAEGYQSQFKQAGAESKVGATAINMRRLVDYREIWPYLVRDAAAALHAADPQAELLVGDVEQLRAIDPGTRRLVALRNLDGTYMPPADGKSTAGRRIAVTMDVEFTERGQINFLNDTVAKWLRENAERPGVPYRILNTADAPISLNPTALTEVRIGTDGGETAIKGPGTGASSRPPASPGRRAPEDRPPPLRPPGADSGGDAGGATGGAGISGGGGGKRKSDGPKIRAPGRDSGDSGPGLSSGGTAAPAPTRPPPRDQEDRGADDPIDRPAAGPKGGELDARAPLPALPNPFPPNTVVYRVPITFTVELIDRNPAVAAAAPKPATTAPAEDES